MNFYIADLHLGHDKIVEREKRPFRDTTDMDEQLIKNWNSHVTYKDTVYILGDFIFKKNLWPYYLNRLAGKKVLLRGNHDPATFNNDVRKYFDEITDYKEILDDGRRVIMCHYPIPFHKYDYDRNIWMLYGHVHNTREYKYLQALRQELKDSREYEWHSRGNFINIGCMMPWMDYTPRTLDEIIAGDGMETEID